MNDYGFIKLSRKVFSGDLWNSKRTYSEWEAWIDLIQSARFEPIVGVCNVGVASIDLDRGQLVGSVRYLSGRWQWSDKKVRVFLDRLKRDKMIKTETVKGHTVITLLNYNKYNDSIEGTGKGTPKGTDNEQMLKELTDGVAQLRTQLRAQQEILENLGHSKGTTLKNDKNIKKPSKEGKESDESGDSHTLFPNDGSNEEFTALVKWVSDNTPYCYDPKNWEHGITRQEYERLRTRYGYSYTEIANVISDINNRKDLRKRYINLYKTTLNWLKNLKK